MIRISLDGSVASGDPGLTQSAYFMLPTTLSEEDSSPVSCCAIVEESTAFSSKSGIEM